MTKRSKGTYEVGYGRPPALTQFKPGQSGNPRGRPKGSKNVASLATRVFSRPITVTQDGRTRKVTVAEAIFIKIASRALSGDTSSQRLVTHLLQAAEAEAPQITTLFETNDDRALLRSVLADLGVAEAKADAGAADPEEELAP